MFNDNKIAHLSNKHFSRNKCFSQNKHLWKIGVEILNGKYKANINGDPVLKDRPNKIQLSSSLEVAILL